MMKLFDTHTHFDVDEFDIDRQALAIRAKQQGVEGLILIGLTAERLPIMLDVQRQMEEWEKAGFAVPKSYLAPGLHPIYIEQHELAHLDELERCLQQNFCVAIGEIGLDRFLVEHKTAEMQAKQQQFFSAQLELAKQYQLPVLLHIRKAHAESLALLKKHRFQWGGIAHAFSGGIEEAKAFIQLGFKLGITGQITNPNAKKLRQVVQAVGVQHIVIETDCPDMTPLCCQDPTQQRTRNTPENLPYVLAGLSEVVQRPVDEVAEQVWQNTFECLLGF